MSASGRLDSSITIRSFVCHNGQIRGWAGGGIVADSEAKMEFVETEEKLGKLMAVLAEPE
jgi:para-aminobenzoate synthetase component 1